MLCLQRSNKIAGNNLRALSIISPRDRSSDSVHRFAQSTPFVLFTILLSVRLRG